MDIAWTCSPDPSLEKKEKKKKHYLPCISTRISQEIATMSQTVLSSAKINFPMKSQRFQY